MKVLNLVKLKIINMHQAILYMREAIKLAKIALIENEIPVGCVIVNQTTHKIIAKAYNQVEKQHDPLAHAELIAVQYYVNNYDYKNPHDHISVFTTLEPCLMCFGAITQARINSIYFGSYTKKPQNLTDVITNIPIYSGICSVECSNLLKNFFSQLRNKKLSSKN